MTICMPLPALIPQSELYHDAFTRIARTARKSIGFTMPFNDFVARALEGCSDSMSRQLSVWIEYLLDPLVSWSLVDEMMDFGDQGAPQYVATVGDARLLIGNDNEEEFSVRIRAC